MLIPDPPTPQPIGSISPTLYETMLACTARAAWSAQGPRDALAPHPSALLGVCFHGVMEAVQKGQVTGTYDDYRTGARKIFDKLAAAIHADAHPLIRVKFPVPEKLPFYNLFRERAAALAAGHAAGQQSDAESSGGRRAIAEQQLESSDGVIRGRPDLLDADRSEVIDYKTGSSAEEPWRVSEREARQLSLYAYLAAEADIDIRKGTIVRGNGEMATIDITPSIAQAEAQRARHALAEYNAAASSGATFQDLARPSPDSCRTCPCVPMCEAFWQAANNTWCAEAGIHVEGTVTDAHTADAQGTPLLTVEVEASRGTLGAQALTIEQIPVAWTTADGDRSPVPGDLVRLTDARLISDDPIVVRADRVMTSLWRRAGNK